MRIGPPPPRGKLPFPFGNRLAGGMARSSGVDHSVSRLKKLHVVVASEAKQSLPAARHCSASERLIQAEIASSLALLATTLCKLLPVRNPTVRAHKGSG